ncbi:MAG: putative nicotinate-nucleotide adenylyltransferase [bacterium]|nr:MAG: putative nicotinate-nucleotide adenylyltransferase [bacterium]
MKSGILGGSFNPIHTGHLLIAEHVRDCFKLDQIVFIPAKTPPHKDIAPGISDEDRFNMVQLAVEGNPGFKASRMELERGGISYTIDTIRQIIFDTKIEGKIHLIIGGDLIKDIYKWRDYQDLITLVQIVVVNREGDLAENYFSEYPFIQSLETVAFYVTSTLVRERVAEGKSIKYLVPEKVENYIYRHHLYQH